MATLTLQLRSLPPVSHVLRDDTITVGRMKGNNIVLDDESVSLTHARLTRKNGVYYLKDLNSTNGTIVNGQRITEALLREGDQICFAGIHGQFLGDTPGEAGTLGPAPVVTSAPKALPQASATGSTPVAPRPPRRVSVLVPFVAVVVLLLVSWAGWKTYLDHRPAAGVNTPDLPAQPNLSGAEQAPAPSPAVAPRTEASGSSVAAFARALKDPNPAERQRAAKALHSLGTEAKDATLELREALADTDPDVRLWAALTLVNNQCHDKATIPILLDALRHDNPTLRQVACLSLGLIPYEGAETEKVLPALETAASKDADEDVRKAALSALGILAPDAAVRLGAK